MHAKDAAKPANLAPSPEFLLLLTGSQSALYASITATLGGTESAQDILQETNVVLLEKWHEFDVARPFLPWAMTFARFQVLAWRKKQSRDRLVLSDAIFDQVADALASAPPPPSRQLDALEACYQKLSTEWRRLMDARYQKGEAVRDIAQALGQTENVVSVTLFRIRKTLLECMQKNLAAEGGS